MTPVPDRPPLDLVHEICNIGQRSFGQDYVGRIALNLVRVLGCRYALIGVPAMSDTPAIQTLAVAAGDTLVENFIYELAGSPCEIVLSGRRVCGYPSNVAQTFPEDLLLQTMAVESYFGAPMIDDSAELRGLAVILDAAPAGNPQTLAAVLEFVASRVAVELDREQQRADRAAHAVQSVQRSNLETLGALATGIAHDFNNVLAGILGQLELIEMKTPPQSAIREHLSNARETAERARHITRRLMSFARVDEASGEGCRAHEIIEATAEVAQHTLRQRLSFELHLKATHDQVRMDRGQLQQLLINLIINAGDAMPEGGSIKIVTADETIAGPGAEGIGATRLLIAVEDEGTGMSEDVLGRIFEPFFSTKGSGFRFGMGLANVKSIVESSGGSIRIDSEPGRGSRFEILLPIRAIQPAEVARAMPDDTNRQTLLIIEDNRNVRQFMREFLELYDYRVLVAADGQRGLEQLERFGDEIDLVISDINMPGKSGFAILQAILDSRRDLPCLIITGDPSAPAPKQLYDLPNLGLLDKPFLGDELLAEVRKMLPPTTVAA